MVRIWRWLLGPLDDERGASTVENGQISAIVDFVPRSVESIERQGRRSSAGGDTVGDPFTLAIVQETDRSFSGLRPCAGWSSPSGRTSGTSSPRSS